MPAELRIRLFMGACWKVVAILQSVSADVVAGAGKHCSGIHAGRGVRGCVAAA